MCLIKNNYLGFTLVELAVVLLIIGLLLGGLLMPLSTQIEQRERREVAEQLDDIKQALLGYAVINGNLPCPTRISDPTDPDYGTPGSGNCEADGILPWKVLGVSETDPWGSPRKSNTDSWRGHWHYRVDDNFTNNFDLSSTPNNDLTVEKNVGGSSTTLTATGDNTPVFIVYSTGPNTSADGENADSALIEYDDTPNDDPIFEGGEPRENFDDIVVWMTRPILFSTMLSARKLPN